MGKRHGGLSVLACLLCAGALAYCLPSIAADSAVGRNASGPLSAPPPSRAPGQQAAPHFGFPLQPTFGFAAPPSGGGDGYPFIGSNPTVPLPTGMTNTTTVLPTATEVLGHAASVRVQITMIGLAALFFSILFLLSSTS